MADVVVSNSPYAWSEAFHFVPKDEHLVMFLQNRLGLPVPGIPGITIREVNVYGDLTPREIFAKSEFRGPNKTDKERYCFTQLKRTTPGGKRFVRRTGGGTWKLQRGEDIINHTALKRSFSYKRSNSAQGLSGSNCSYMTQPDDSGWIMYEYSLQGQDIALCKIIKKNPSRKHDRSEEDEGDMPRNGSSKRCWPLETSNTDNVVHPCNNISNGDDFYASNGFCTIPTPEATNEGLYGGGVEMMPSTSTIMPSCPSNDLSFALEELRDTTMIPSCRTCNPSFVVSPSLTISPNGDGIFTANEGLYEGGDESMPSTKMMPSSTCDDFSLLLEELLDTTTIPSCRTSDPSFVASLSSTISPNGDGICTRPTSEAANEGLYEGGDESMPSTTMMPSSPCSDFSLLLEELLDTTMDIPSGHGIEDIDISPPPAELLEMAEPGEWLKIMNGMG